MLKGAVFDLDGVILDTEFFQWQGWIEVLKPFKIFLSKEKYLDYAGKAGSIVAEQLIKEYNLDIKKEVLLAQKEKLVFEWFNKEYLRILPFAEDAIKFFVNKKIKTAIVSGGPRKETILKLERSGLRNLFEKIITGSDVSKGKPNPDIYTFAVNKLNLSAKDCVAFEDTEYGVSSAKSAGLICIAIPNEFSGKQNFLKADVVVHNLKEAVDWVSRNYYI